MMAERMSAAEDLSPAVERFLKYKLVIQGRSVRTVSEYRSDLHLFFQYLIASKEGRPTEGEEFAAISIAGVDTAFVKTITSLDILEFLFYIANTKENAPAARARKLSAIRAFFKYMVATEHVLEKNPAADIETPKKKTVLPKYLTQDESLDLLTAVAEDHESKNKERDYCIITLFLNCGMRLSELVGINISDIDKEMRSLRVVGKGNKERIVYLNDACRDALSSYLLCRTRAENIQDKNALFLSRLQKRMGRQAVQNVVYKYLREAGMENKHFSTHKLRHTAATLMYQEGGVDVLALKEILGHEQLSTTQIYTHIGNKQLEEAVAKNPLADVRRKTVARRRMKKEEDE